MNKENEITEKDIIINQLIENEYNKKKKNAVIYSILSIFIGATGVQRFYLGQKAIGFLYIIILLTLPSVMPEIFKLWAFIILISEGVLGFLWVRSHNNNLKESIKKDIESDELRKKLLNM